jgi:hypothetical protein
MRAVVISQLEAHAAVSDTGFDYTATIARTEQFIGDGEALRWRLVAIAHGDDTVERGDREEIHRWQAMASQIVARAAADVVRDRE